MSAEYTPPCVIDLGSVRELTLSGGATKCDGGIGHRSQSGDISVCT